MGPKSEGHPLILFQTNYWVLRYLDFIRYLIYLYPRSYITSLIGNYILFRACSREFPGSRFSGNLRILAIFPVFPGIKIQDPGNSRKFPGILAFEFSRFPGKEKVRENANSNPDASLRTDSSVGSLLCFHKECFHCTLGFQTTATIKMDSIIYLFKCVVPTCSCVIHGADALVN